MPYIFIKKGSSNASFFIGFIFYLLSFNLQASTNEAVDLSKVKEISGSSTWMSLLHSDGNKSYITDPDFLLTSKSFSPEAELLATIDYLYSDDVSAVCRFPARYLWLQRQLHLSNLDIDKCKELTEYQQRAPVDDVYLVFASENITQPSSMMGHVFLKISGINANQIETNHAISFYTNIEGFNVPKIIYQNFISGKEGYFSLTPYSEKLSRYSNLENRNVWEYHLNSNNFNKKLLQYHFYELKQTKLIYFFDKYNCATLTQFMLGIAGDKKFTSGAFGTSPLDIIQQAERNSLYDGVELIPSKKWKLRMLTEHLDKNSINVIKKSINLKSTKNLVQINQDKDRFIAYEILEAYTELQINNKGDNADRILYNQIKSEKNNYPFDINLIDYKSPLKSPPDSQMSLEISHFMDDEIMIFNILPGSHKLEDDNSQYFGETSLILGDISIARSTKTDAVFINRLTLFESKSLLPHDYFTGGISGSFSIGAKQQYDIDFENHLKSYIDGSVGKTYRLGKDISVYGLFGGGISLSKGDFFTEITPEFGIIVNEVFNMKSIIQYQHNFNNSTSLPDYSSYSFSQSLFIGKNWGLFGKLENLRILNRDEEKFSIWMKHYF